jgi:hypothetical protein
VQALGTSAARGDLDDVVRTMPVLAFSVVGVEHTVAVAARDAVDKASTGQAMLDRALDFPGLAALMVAPGGQSKWDGVVRWTSVPGRGWSRRTRRDHPQPRQARPGGGWAGPPT